MWQKPGGPEKKLKYQKASFEKLELKHCTKWRKVEYKTIKIEIKDLIRLLTENCLQKRTTYHNEVKTNLSCGQNKQGETLEDFRRRLIEIKCDFNTISAEKHSYQTI